MSSASPPKARPDSIDSRRKKLSRNTQTRKAVSSRRRARRSSGAVAVETAAALAAGEGGTAGRQELGLREADEEGDEGTPRRLWPFLRVFVEKKFLRQFFRYFNNLHL